MLNKKTLSTMCGKCISHQIKFTEQQRAWKPLTISC